MRMTRGLYLLSPVLLDYNWKSFLRTSREILDLCWHTLSQKRSSDTSKEHARSGLRDISALMNAIVSRNAYDEAGIAIDSENLALLLECITLDSNESSVYSILDIVGHVTRVDSKLLCEAGFSLLHLMDKLVRCTLSGFFRCANVVYTDTRIFHKLCICLFGPSAVKSLANTGCNSPTDTVVLFLLDKILKCCVNHETFENGEAFICRHLLHTLVEVFSESALSTPLRLHGEVGEEEAEVDYASGSGEWVVEHMQSVVNLLRKDDHSCHDAMYEILADLYRLWICESNIADGLDNSIDLFSLPAELEESLLYVALHSPPDSILGAGWLNFSSAYVQLSGKHFERGGRYMAPIFIEKMMHKISEVLISSLEKDADTSQRTMAVVASILSVTPPDQRENLVARPILAAVRIMSLRGGHSLTALSCVNSLLHGARCDWRDGAGAALARRNFRKSVLQQACFIVESSVTSSRLASDSSHTKFENYCRQLKSAAELFYDELRYSVSALNPPKRNTGRGARGTHHNKAEEAADRQSYNSLLGDVFEASVLFLSSSFSFIAAYCPSTLVGSSVYSSGDKRSGILCEIALSVMKLLAEVVSCPPVAIVNSNIGSIVLILRQLTIVSIVLASQNTPEDRLSAGHASGTDVLRTAGRVLMSSASSKHLHKHAYVIVVGIIDALTIFTTKHSLERLVDGSVETQLLQASSLEIRTHGIAVSSSDERLREHFFPGVFALLDRYRAYMRQSTNIYNIHVLNSLLLGAGQPSNKS